jgi:hypothetical protein
MGFIVLPSISAGTSKARIGYENHLETASSVVATTEDADFPVANVYDWLTFDFFKPTGTGTTNIDATFAEPVTADYFAYYNQDLFNLSGIIKLQYWDGLAYQNCFAAISPADNSPQMKVFAAKTSDKWRVVVTCSSVFSLGCVSFGTHLALQYGMYLGWTPPVLARDTQLVTSRSDGGAFLGRSVIAKGIKTDLILQYATDLWTRTYWTPLIKHIEQKPFFFMPNVEDYPTEAAYCWVEEAIPPPTHTHFGFMGTTIPIKGLVE